METNSQYQVPHVYIIRHGEALHNIDQNNPTRDPALTSKGHASTKKITLPVQPDFLVVSPMTRTIQTALNMFPFLREHDKFPMPVEIWPDLRETLDSECNKGLPRAEMSRRYPQFDFSSCQEDWNYSPHTIERATARAESVRKRLKNLSATYSNIFVVTHRGFIGFLAKGRRFTTSEIRTYRFATYEEIQNPTMRHGINCDTLLAQDFGPTVLVLERDARKDIITSLS